MNEFITAGDFRRMNYASGFGYTLSREDLLSNTDYRVMQGLTESILLPCIRMKYNGCPELLFLAGNARPLPERLPRISETGRVSVCLNLMQAVLDIAGNGLLNISCIDLSWEHVYVESGTLRVRLAYVPVRVSQTQSLPALSEDLKAALAGLLRNAAERDASKGKISNDETEGFIAQLMDTSISMEEICRSRPGVLPSAGGEPGPGSGRPGTGIEGPGAGGGISRLVAKDAPEPFEILLKKEDLLIGRTKDADAPVPFSRMISRRHCRICHKNGEWFIQDLGSINGTSINHVRLLSQELCVLHMGDIVSIADVDFEVR